MPEWNVYSSSYNYSAQASERGERAVFIRIGGIYPIWSKHAYMSRTQASTHMKRADTISDTDSLLEYASEYYIRFLDRGQLGFMPTKSVFNFESC